NNKHTKYRRYCQEICDMPDPSRPSLLSYWINQRTLRLNTSGLCPEDCLFSVGVTNTYSICWERNSTSEVNSSYDRALASPLGIIEISSSFRFSIFDFSMLVACPAIFRITRWSAVSLVTNPV